MTLGAHSLPQMRPDYAVFDPEHQIRLVVETKAVRGLDSKAVAELGATRRWGTTPALLATPEGIFFWQEGTPLGHPPSCTLDAVPLLSRYLTAIQTGTRLDPQIFEWAVGSWLEDLLAGDPQPVSLDALGSWLTALPPGSTLVREALLREGSW